MSVKILKKLAVSAAVIGAAVGFSPQAEATNGYFVYGFGPTGKGMAGASTAYSKDALAAATNPAGMAFIGRRADIDITLFNPNRSFVADSLGAITTTETDSLETLFEIPNFGVNYPIDDKMSFGITMNAHGGMNTEYPIAVFQAFNSPGNVSTKPTGVDLAIATLGATVSYKIAPKHAIGFTPTLTFSRFKAYGLQPFQTVSAFPTDLTDRGYDNSIGGGFRAGYQGEIADGLTLGLAYQSRQYMKPFNKYRGLFAEKGDFDIPQSTNIGLAYKASPQLVLAFDWQWINYNQVAAIANTAGKLLTPVAANPNSVFKMGLDQGLGFGWEDMNIFKFGAEYRHSDKLTLSVGFSWNDRNPFDADQILFNVLAPAVIRSHATIGLSYRINENSSLNLSYARAFREDFSGTDVNTGAQIIKLEMDQNIGTIGYTYRW